MSLADSDDEDRIVNALKSSPSGMLSSYQLGEATGFPSAKLYPLIVTMERKCTLASSWEDDAEPSSDRARRRMYRLPC